MGKIIFWSGEGAEGEYSFRPKYTIDQKSTFSVNCAKKTFEFITNTDRPNILSQAVNTKTDFHTILYIWCAI
jgi:hypothetical protein